MHNVKKEALIMMIRDYAAEKKYELQYDYDRFEEYTTFYVNREAHTIVWDHFDNIYKAFDMFIESVEKKQKPEVPRQISLVTARGSGKSVVKEIFDYCCNDVEVTRALWPKVNPYINSCKIKDVIFNDPATIVFWTDGSKSVVKCQECDKYDPEKGLAMAICKKFLGNQGNYYNVINKWLEKYELKQMVEFDFTQWLPNVSEMHDNLQKIINSITLVKDDDEIKKEEILEKIDRVLTAFDTCTTSYGCIRCPYDTNKGKNCTSDRRVENIELLKDFRSILTKDDV